MQTFAVKSEAAPRRQSPIRPAPAVRHILRAPAIQTKLTVGAAGDPAEQEADRVAGEVMRMPDPAAGEPVRVGQASPSPAIHRSCAACAEEDGMLHRRAAAPEAPGMAPDIVHRVLRAPGQPLDPASRAFFEPRVGYDLSGVRIHTGAEAARSAQAINAHAYAMGPDIVFGDGQYAPNSQQGRHMLAHELAHVAQQGAAPAGGGEVRRLVNSARMHCTPAQAGIASPHVGATDRRASELLDHAITRVSNAIAAHAASPADPEVAAVGHAAHTAFRLDPADPDTWTAAAPRAKLPVILRRLQGAKGYIDSVVFDVSCAQVGAAPAMLPPCGATNCNATTSAKSCAGVPAIGICPHFWQDNNDQRARSWLHETLHISFVIIHDYVAAGGGRNPDIHNAHCYDQFVMLLNGLNAPPHRRCH